MSNQKLAIYFAGPDIFYPDYSDHMERIKKLCLSKNITPILPILGSQVEPEPIFRSCLESIHQADMVIANLNPFRGIIEPDSGTVFECAFCYALGKRVIGYLADHRDLLTKLRSARLGPPEGQFIAADGTIVEDFGLPLNLMVAQSLDRLAKNLEEAVEMALNMKLG